MEEAIKKEFFPHHSQTVARLNHGSFGAIPVNVLNKQRSFQQLWLDQPDEFYFFGLRTTQAECRKHLANVINCADTDVGFIENVTSATAIVCQKIMWDMMSEKSTEPVYVIEFNNSYPAVKKVVRGYLERAGAVVVTVDLPFPIDSEAQIIESLENTLKHLAPGRIKLAIIDHLSSVPSYLLPVAELVQVCRNYKVEEIFIDGAHAFGNTPIDVSALDVDYYSSNLHKWMFTPTACAFIYAKPTRNAGPHNQSKSVVHHTVPSFGYGTGISNECSWAGTKDYSAFCCAQIGMQFYALFGRLLKDHLENGAPLPSVASLEEKIHAEKPEVFNYEIANLNRDKALAMGDLLAAAWGTRVAIPKSLITAITMVQLPAWGAIARITNDFEAEQLRHMIRNQYNVEIIIMFNSKDSRSYIRMSCQIYNSESDFLRLRAAVLDLKDK